MSIAIRGMDGNPATTLDVDASGNNFIYGNFRLAFSGSYVTGGDTLDLTAIAALLANSKVLNVFIEGNGTGTQQSAGGGYYMILGNPAVPTALSAYKVKIFAAAGTELGAGAYPAAVTGDYVVIQVMVRKLI